ncbi:hypothetical protein MKEN_01395900 [Mycena kentingensis (nom. inval.)]|nr:hypothetical protein MKEN_01395900 [Mycena kentingensis (nom. inval.)]
MQSRSRRLFILLLLATLAFLYTQIQSASGRDAALMPTSVPLSGNSTILLVSAFFPLSKSKHTMADYENWLCRFLRPITTDIYFYTPPEMADLVRRCRGPLPIHIDTRFTRPFDVPPLRGMEAEYAAMQALDREKRIHSAELYAAWNAKPYLLDEAVKMLAETQQRRYAYAFWNDAGSFRGVHEYTDWPDEGKVREVWREGGRLTGIKEEELLFFPVCRVPHSSYQYWVEDTGPVDGYFGEASFFGGPPEAISWWRTVFYAYHDAYLARGLFVGKDQNLIFALFLLFPERILAVWQDDPDAPAAAKHEYEDLLGTCGANWFYYQFWLASDATQDAMRRIWLAEARSWLSWGWWRERSACRVTRVVAVRELLARQLGRGWRPPASNLLSVGM